MLNTSCRYYLLFLVLLFQSSFVSAAIRIEITGVNDNLEDEIVSNLAISRQAGNGNVSEAGIRALYRRSISEINNILKSKGYYDFRLTDSLEKTGDDWIVNVSIDTGEPVRVRSMYIDIEGDGGNDVPLFRVMNEFPLEEGDQLNHESYETGKRRMQNLARERGYFDASFTTHTINISETEKTADIRLVFNTGTRYRFGNVNIEETVVNRERLEGMIPFSTGDPYEANLLITLSENLRNSYYFNEVIVLPEIDDQRGDHTVPVTVRLTPKPKNNYKVGVGYGTDSGPRLIAGWESRYLNRRGQRLETGLKASTTLSTIEVKHITPDFRRRGTELDLLSSVSRETTDTHTSNTFIFGAQHLQKRGSWNETLSLSYQYENFDVATEKDSNSNLLIPALTYWKMVSESPIYTNEGFRINLNIKGSLKGALSDLSFFQSSLHGKYIHPGGNDGRLIARGELGVTYVENFAGLPASIRYFAGGDNSIRGFDLQTLGPRNEAGEVIGGKYISVGSLEYEHRLFNKISAAIFTDFGNAFNSFSDHFVYSAGVGLRWLTPVGLIRLDFAFGLSEDPSSFRVHFNIGPDL